MGVKSLYAVRCDPKLSRRDAEAIIIDYTEQQIQRPRDEAPQKAHYSAKKKRHTMKTEYVVTRDGRIAAISDSHPGSHHDLAIGREAAKLPAWAHIYADSAYQGYDKAHPSIDFPYKKQKGGSLEEEEEKQYNHRLGSFVSVSITASGIASGSGSSRKDTGTRLERITPRRRLLPDW